MCSSFPRNDEARDSCNRSQKNGSQLVQILASTTPRKSSNNPPQEKASVTDFLFHSFCAKVLRLSIGFCRSGSSCSSPEHSIPT